MAKSITLYIVVTVEQKIANGHFIIANADFPYCSSVDSHIQNFVLATEDTTVTQLVSLRPIKCQSRSWSQIRTKVNGSHHGDSPLLKPVGA